MGIFDFLKKEELKKIDVLTLENEKINKMYKELSETKLSIEQMSVLELQKNISEKTNELATVNQSISEKTNFLNEVLTRINNLLSHERNLQSQLTVLESDIAMEEFGLYKPRYDFASSLEYKDKLNVIREMQKAMIKSKSAVNYFENWTVDGSKAKGKKMTNDNIKMILRSFNNECEAAINKVKFSNIQSIEKRIQTSFNQHNKLNETNKVSLTQRFLDLKLQELYLAFEYEQKKEEEKEALREQREKEKEEKALQKEIESKKKVIHKEMSHLENVISELEMKLIVADESEKESLEAQILELKENLNKFEEEIEELDYRTANAAAGYVYVISNIGSFGEDVVKIGVTRRLDPLERISELSSASVPFKFDVHALIFSYDAYNLEASLHNKFSDKRLNAVNNRKEFFKIPIDEIENELQIYKDLTIDFSKVPEAQEYRESLKLRG
ncbi:Hypothetical protein TFLO_1942 [Trichococcus flocculiformis]|uniref:T5orf172 domain-containing protein n=1 Tax=Trichococcus flocculiformis TaxID=82803 RepID=A0AB38BJX8_9LACT|nr:DUF4041 domain-containing protein [Trichococcus flocculiformis]CZQ95475.1 Hypothetical protein TFLO_1942 [Trichococcus flocculiformis]SFI02208.1 T5orf172 domain-containing protein [Trichococcus flocculiformis]